MYVCVSGSRFFSLQHQRLGSVAEESSLKASAETIVGHFAVSVVSDNTVVAGLLDGMSDNGRADIRSASTDFRHGLVLVLRLSLQTHVYALLQTHSHRLRARWYYR